MELSRLVDSMRRAVDRAPEDAVLRTHLAELLLQAGQNPEAIGHLGRLLAEDPGDPDILDLMRRATQLDPGPAAWTRSDVPGLAGGPDDFGEFLSSLTEAAPAGGFDWRAAEHDLLGGMSHEPVQTNLRLADVGGLTQVKAQIESAFLTPLRNPELRERYGATLRGGLLLYGPPGCGKTHLARAIAGELGASFIAVSLADVLSRWTGQSEGNVAQTFTYARSQAPCVVFLDEVDAYPASADEEGDPEPPRVYRRAFGSMIRLLFRQRSSLRRRPPLLRSA